MHQPSWSYASSITQPSWLWFINMERATQDGYITNRSIHEKNIMHQPSLSYASSITQLLALELLTWKELHKTVTSHTDQYTKRLLCINLHDHTHQPYRNHLGVGVINMERATQDGYIRDRSIHKKIIMHQPSWSYAWSITQPSWRWSYQHGKSYARWLHHTRINTRKDYHESTLWSYASSITQPSWRWSYKHGKRYAKWLHHTPINTRKDYHASTFMIITSSINQPSWRCSYQHGKSYTRWLHHTPINTRKDYHASTFLIIRIKHNPTILALELSTWKELRKMVTSHTDQCTKR